jgi:succinate dehydrogenase/fumarate reductase flavoprotein subunit
MTSQKTLISQRIEAVRTPRAADERTLRLCFSEQDAIVASIQLSGLTYREIAARMGKGKSLVDAMAKGQRALTRKNTQAFMHATGTRLIEQYREMKRAMDIAAGVVRERDRIAAIVAPTQQTWASYGRAAA